MEKVELLPVTLKRTSETVRPPVRRILALPPMSKAPEMLSTNAEPAAPLSVNVPPLPLFIPPPITKLDRFMTYLPPNGLLLIVMLWFLPRLIDVGEPAVAVSPAAVIDTFFNDMTPLFSCELIDVLENRDPVMVPVVLIDSV